MVLPGFATDHVCRRQRSVSHTHSPPPPPLTSTYPPQGDQDSRRASLSPCCSATLLCAATSHTCTPGMPAMPTASIVPHGDHARQDTCPPPRAGSHDAQVLPSRPGLRMGVPEGPAGVVVIHHRGGVATTSLNVPQHDASSAPHCECVGGCWTPCKAGDAGLQLVCKDKARAWRLAGRVWWLQGGWRGDVHAVLVVGSGQEGGGGVPRQEWALEQLG